MEYSREDLLEILQTCFNKINQIWPQLDLRFFYLEYQPGWSGFEFFWTYPNGKERFRDRLSLYIDILEGNPVDDDPEFNAKIAKVCGSDQTDKPNWKGILTLCFYIYKKATLKNCFHDYLTSLMPQEHWQKMQKERTRKYRNARRRELYHQKKLQSSLQP